MKYLFVALAALTACTSTAPAETDDPFGSVQPEALDVQDLRVRCSFGADGTRQYRDAAAWQELLDTCVGETSAPDIDFDTKDVIGAVVTLDCPFDGAPVELLPDITDGVLTPHVWTWKDHCFCDYFESHISLFVVPKDTLVPAEIELTHEVTCDKTVCLCDDETTKSACDETKWCPITDSYTLEVDGLPPTQ